MHIGVDIGGTFTDLVMVDGEGMLHTAKTPSTPDDPSRGVMEGLKLLAEAGGVSVGELLAGTELFIHGTTVATNLLVERKGARLGMISTQGFRDILELREGTKANRYDLRAPFPQPLITRPLRLTVPERTRWDGAVETPLDEDAVRTALAALRDEGVAGLVVCFLHAHRNGSHEARVRALLEEMDWSPYLSLSHEVLPREGEYDRASTATVNAYVGPGLGGYLTRLQQRLSEAGLKLPMLVMQSTGGVLPVERASGHAVGAITSGPAGGAMAGALYAKLAGCTHAVTYDMGGTSTDICLIEDGQPLERQQTLLEDVKIAVPALDVAALGAGGGSIAWIDAGGILDLGPQSAGAEPGPACYGRGGMEPTLTDANLVLGYIAPETFLGGRLSLSLDKARAAISDRIAGPLGLGVEEAALAINALGSSRIAEGIRASTVRRGLDPRDFTLFCFGGAGGLHAETVARELSIPRAIVPREASVLSALGFLSADVRQDHYRAVGQRFGDVGAEGLRDVFAELEGGGRARLAADGFTGDRVRVVRRIDCRYQRQVFTVQVEASDDDLQQDGLDWLRGKFEAVYAALYRHAHGDQEGFIDGCHLVMYGVLPELALPRLAEGTADPSPARRGARRIYLAGWVDADVYWFDDLRHGMRISGPAVVDSASTSVVIGPGGGATVDPYGSLVIDLDVE